LLITKVLEYSINVRFAEGAFNTQFNNPFLNPILSYLATNRAWAKGFPLLYAYATLYRILQEHDRRWLAAWLHFIAQHTAQFDRAELRKLYSYAENIAATIINKNTSDIAAYALLFTIYSQQQKLGFFLESDNSMDEGKFRNYVNIAIKCSELTAAASFITSYEGSLNTIHKDDIVQYAQALVLFETRKFDEVIHNIRLNTFREEDFLLRAEIVLIKAWFERVETEHSDKGRHLEHGTCDIIQAFEQKIGAATSIAAAPRQKFNTTVFAFTQLVVLFDTTKKGYVKTDKKAELLALVDWFLAQANLLDKTWFLLKCNRF
jgi:hypothetical protein